MWYHKYYAEWKVNESRQYGSMLDYSHKHIYIYILNDSYIIIINILINRENWVHSSQNCHQNWFPELSPFATDGDDV